MQQVYYIFISSKRLVTPYSQFGIVIIITDKSCTHGPPLQVNKKSRQESEALLKVKKAFSQIESLQQEVRQDTVSAS